MVDMVIVFKKIPGERANYFFSSKYIPVLTLVGFMVCSSWVTTSPTTLLFLSCREVNPYKKVATSYKLFLCTVVDQDVHNFLFISDEHIVKQSKQVCYKIIFIKIVYLLYTMIFKRYSILSEI